MDEKNLTPNEIAGLVGTTLVNRICNDHPELCIELLQKHGEKPADDTNTNIMKLLALSQERGRFFDEDFAEVADKAGYYGTDKVLNATGGVIDTLTTIAGGVGAGMFGLPPGVGTALAGATNTVKHKLIDGIKEKLKKVFNKKGEKPTPLEVSENPDAKTLVTGKLPQDDKPQSTTKKWLGVPVWVWITGGSVILILVIILIVWKLKKNKAAAAAAAAA